MQEWMLITQEVILKETDWVKLGKWKTINGSKQSFESKMV